MKKTLVTMAMLAGAVSGYSQAQISFYNYASGLKQQIYNTQASASTSVSYGGFTVTELVGNGTAKVETPSGTVAYTANGLTGTGFDAQIYAADGGSAGYSALASEGTPLQFRTSPPGMLNGTETVNLDASINAGDTVTLAIAAWANTGTQGAATSLAAAQADGYAWGMSPLWTEVSGGGINPPASMPVAAGSAGFQSFSLGTSGAVTPEPSTIALGVLGASSLLFRRRK